MRRHRTRTKEELQRCVTVAHQAASILESFNLEYLAGGAMLLGMVRDGGLMPWVDGVVFMVQTEEVSPIESSLDSSFAIHGFKSKRGGRGSFKVYWKRNFTKDRFTVELTGYTNLDGDMVHWCKQGVLVIPPVFFKDRSTYNFYGMELPCPSDTNGFLTWCYGDWETPLKPGGKKAGHCNSNWIRSI